VKLEYIVLVEHSFLDVFFLNAIFLHDAVIHQALHAHTLDQFSLQKVVFVLADIVDLVVVHDVSIELPS
jgi:hypothetical protein